MLSYYELFGFKQGADDATVTQMTKYAHFAVHVEGAGPVLDFGCGWGHLLKALTAAGLQCEGIDINKEQVLETRARGENAEHVNDSLAWLRTQVANKKKWSTVFLMDVYEHFPAESQTELIYLLYQLLPKGGRIILKCPNPDSIAGLRMTCCDVTHKFTPTSDELANILKATGFEKIKISDEIPWNNPYRLELLRMLFGSSEEKLHARRNLFYFLSKKFFRTLRKWELASEIGLETSARLPLSPNYLCITNK